MMAATQPTGYPNLPQPNRNPPPAQQKSPGDYQRAYEIFIGFSEEQVR